MQQSETGEPAEAEVAEAMDAEAIAEAIRNLEVQTRRRAVSDVIATLREGWPIDDDDDTWAAGFAAAIEVIKANFAH